MDRTCSRCGCSGFHYNRARMRMECDSCGAPIHDEEQAQQLMQYDRTYAQAAEHLRAGNWGRVIELLQPLVSRHPADRKLYLTILRAATKDFGDVAMADESSRRIASDAWDKLVRLNGVSAAMLRYAEKRYGLRRAELERQRNRLLAWIFAAAVCSVLAGVFFGETMYFWATVSVAGLVGCLCKVSAYRPVGLMRRLRTTPGGRSNPFG